MMEPIRNLPFGTTRGRGAGQYPLIPPDTHVPSPLVGWRGASAVVHISPELGARFAQYTVVLGSGAASALPGEGIERFLFVIAGSVKLAVEGKSHELAEGQFAFIPAGTPHELTTPATGKSDVARLAMFEKRYQPGRADAPLVRI